MREHRLRSGMSLVEVLVTIAVVLGLLALLLPAVQSAREQARGIICQSHIRQLAMAVHSHETIQHHIPTGGWGWRWVGDPGRGFGLAQPGGWIYGLLPYIEQPELRNAGSGLARQELDASAKHIAAVRVRLMCCPARRTGKSLPFVHAVDFVNMQRPSVVFRGDYAACSGNKAPDVRAGRGRGPQSLAQGDHPQYGWRDTAMTGVVFRRSRVRFAEIADGLSHTYLLGEKYVAARDYASGRAQNDDQCLFVGFDSDSLRTTDLHFPPTHDSSNLRRDHSFGSAHPTTFHMALCDGSIKALSYSIEAHIHNRLGHRGDGQ